MADTRQRTTLGNWFRFAARAAGLTGLLAAAIGAALLYTEFRDHTDTLFSLDRLREVWEGAHGEFAKIAAYVAGVGAAVAVMVLLLELISGLLFTSGRRTAVGGVATVGMAAAVVLLVLVNIVSFRHYQRFDCTRDQRFTLPPQLVLELRKLRASSPTTIVVLQKHNIFGNLTQQRDSFTSAAERQVTEKVQDLVDQFREFGPQFTVVVLDTEAFGYDQQLNTLTKDAPELKQAIESAQENSIFFHANKHVQRLSFNEFMLLDKSASRSADGGRANLVLIPQGIDTFARRILMVNERRPKVAICAVHEWLSSEMTEGTKQYTLAGLKQSLTNNGFDVVDIILKKNWEDETRELEPAAYLLEESKLERLEAEEESAREEVLAAHTDVKVLVQLKAVAEELQGQPLRDRVEFYNELQRGARLREWTELLAAFRKWDSHGSPQINETNHADLKTLIFAGLDAQANLAREKVKEAEEDQRAAKSKVDAALADERTVQDRRISDVKAKLARLVADVDVLIVPRHTLMNASIRSGISPGLYPLDKKQVEVIKEFMKAGKPVLACLGPISTLNGPSPIASDGFEQLLRDRGIELGRETILFDSERKALAAAQAGRQLIGSGPTEIPPLLLVDEPAGSRLKANPISSALRLTSRTVDQKLDIHMLAMRPVYLAHGWQEKQDFTGEFLLTAPNAWNEERPFFTTDQRGRVTYIPRYERTPEDDPKRGTIAEKRRSSFPVGVAIESRIPASWVNEEVEPEQKIAGLLLPLDGTFAAVVTAAADSLIRPKQRTVVIGSGHIFSGQELKPAQERLLLNTLNWLTHREDRLPNPGNVQTPAWSYPRVAMSDRDRDLWRMGTAAGMPLVVGYIGMLVMLRRRMR